MPGSQRDAAETSAKILSALRAVEDLPYDGEPVSQLEHALQCADLAHQEGHDPDVVAAALLHDVGRSPAALADLRQAGVESSEHGYLAGVWLRPLLGERVAWLAEQHVPAKRYLVATDPSYREGLTATSLRTLREQGGPMIPEEVREFERHLQWREAVALRRWDDLGKEPGARVPSLEAYEEALRSVVLSRQQSSGEGVREAQ